MPRGVKAGSKRGCYKRHSKPRLRKLARDILAGKADPEEVAQAFESTNRVTDCLIARHLRQGNGYHPQRLAQAVEALATQQKPPLNQKPLPMWQVKAALKHLAEGHGGKGQPIHKALGVEFPYAENSRVRAYHRQLVRDYGPRSKKRLIRELDELWPMPMREKYPELEEAIKQSLSGYGVPLEVWRSWMRKLAMRKGDI